jgi:hypothetical protein
MVHTKSECASASLSKTGLDSHAFTSGTESTGQVMSLSKPETWGATHRHDRQGIDVRRLILLIGPHPRCEQPIRIMLPAPPFP